MHKSKQKKEEKEVVLFPRIMYVFGYTLGLLCFEGYKERIDTPLNVEQD